MAKYPKIIEKEFFLIFYFYRQCQHWATYNLFQKSMNFIGDRCHLMMLYVNACSSLAN